MAGSIAALLRALAIDPPVELSLVEVAGQATVPAYTDAEMASPITTAAIRCRFIDMFVQLPSGESDLTCLRRQINNTHGAAGGKSARGNA